MSRRTAEFFPGYAHIADPLIDEADHGMTVASLRPLFAELRKELVPLVEAIKERPAPDSSFLHRDYPEPQQQAFGARCCPALRLRSAARPAG